MVDDKVSSGNMSGKDDGDAKVTAVKTADVADVAITMASARADQSATEPAKVGRRKTYVNMFKEFMHTKPNPFNKLVKAANNGEPIIVDFSMLSKFSGELADFLLEKPDEMFSIAEEAIGQIDLPGPVKPRFTGLADDVSIRNLRSKHIGKFSCVEGVVRRASEVRPRIVETIWECNDCGERMEQPVKFGFISKPFQCSCGARSFTQIDKKMIDTRMISIEEPFELTEGDKPSQVGVVLSEDLISPDNRKMTDPGNRIKIYGVLREMPKDNKRFSAKLDFFLDANHVEPTEAEWRTIVITKKDEEEIKKMAKDSKIYEKLVDSLAPSLYGLREIKESIILQLFAGVPRTLKDRTNFRGDIHILCIGDPASGKSQLLKLTPEIVPRGRYVSGKGVTAAGLTASVIKDELMGGWVLEAGAMVLANKGLLSVDEFEKMSNDDQVAMHEAMEQGTISIAKASIVATLPAKTSILAGGNPKFSRFDSYKSVAEQIDITDTLLSRFDLKFILRDIPNAERDKKVVDHILNSRSGGEEGKPNIDPGMVRKYIAYAKKNCSPELTEEAGKTLKTFYTRTRKKAEGGNAPVPITLRQFEALIRLSEASAKIQLSPKVRKEDTQRAIKLMKYSLQQMGFDPTTGQIDVDKSEGGTSFTERTRIRIIMDIIEEFSKTKKAIKIEEVEKAAKKEGVETADEVSTIIEKLKREGMLFEPTVGYIQKV